MTPSSRVFDLVCASLAASLLFLAASPTLAQVSPAEILNPKLKAAEQKYLPQLKSLREAITDSKFPLSFVLTRYVDANPGGTTASDSRGLEFVYFQDQMLLKVTGIYNAAYNGDELTQNERASRTFQDVVVPVLRLVVQQMPADVECDGIGFEIAYHTRTSNKNYDYEGKEILVVVFHWDDAFAYLRAAGDEQRQESLNRSGIFVNGKDFGLALGDRSPFNVEALERSNPKQPAEPPVSATASATARSSIANPGLSPTALATRAHSAPGERADTGIAVAAAPPPAGSAIAAVPAAAPAEPRPAPTPADVERLQTEFQPQLDALVKNAGGKFHLVDYAPPSFAVYHNQIVLQLTMRNPLAFEATTSSIYKRAAQSFDLFLAPQLKALVPGIPADAAYDALDFSVLNHMGAGKGSSEAIEFICPSKSLQAFEMDEITTQDLIDQSIVLVNGVRIALNLQIVE
jgi:hypothetical protein